MDGFFDPVLQRIPFEGVRQRLKRAIEAEQFELAADIRDKLRGIE